MLFLALREEPKRGNNDWRLIGIIVANNLEQAVLKSGLLEIERTITTGADCCCILAVGYGRKQYIIESIKEITGMIEAAA